jgi:hypothetical protein
MEPYVYSPMRLNHPVPNKDITSPGVCIASGLLAGRPGVRIPIEARHFSSKPPYRPWGSPCLLSGCQRSFLGEGPGKAAGSCS